MKLMIFVSWLSAITGQSFSQDEIEDLERHIQGFIPPPMPALPTVTIEDHHAAPIVRPFPAPRSGTLAWLDAGAVGRATVLLGGGRARASDPVDFRVGFSAVRKVGEVVEKDAPLFHIHAREERSLAEALELLRPAVEITDGT